MFRFLIVEDDRSTAETLKLVLEDAFPGALVVFAGDVELASQLLSGATRPFDAVVLDSLLPNGRGETVCQHVREQTSYSTVAHITAHDNDPQLASHLKGEHVHKSQRGFVVYKRLNEPWTEELVLLLSRDLFGLRIGRQLDELFGPEGREPSSTATPRGYRTPKESRTNELADLSRDIVDFWDKVGSDVRVRIKQYFYVDDSGRPIRVALL
jgi:CheY-like chemotaxis protein